MTCIIGLIDNNTVYLGSDSRTTSHGFKFPTDCCKVFSKQNMIFGVCGDVRYNDIIRYRLRIPYHRNDQTIMDYLCTNFVDSLRVTLEEAKYSREENAVASVPYESTMLLGYKNKLYCIFYDYSVLEFSEYHCIGSGSDFALGALEATKNTNMLPSNRIELALEVACKFNSGCGKPFTIIP